MAGEDSPMPEEAMVHVERPTQTGTWICCVPCYWLRRSKAVHKALLTFAMLLVTSLLVTSPVLFLITTLPEGDQQRDCAPLDEACIRERDGQEGVCETRACHEASRRMLAFLKRGVDPCEDFYQFACGGFRDRQPYQPSSSFGTLQAQVDDQIQNMLANASGKMTGAFYKLGQFYETCIDFKDKPVNFTPVYRLLDELGGYLPPKSLAPVDITPLVSELLRLNGAPLFDVYVDVDLYDQTRSSVFLDLPMKYRADTFFPENQKDDGPQWRRSTSLTDEHPRERRSSNIAESRAYTFIKNNMAERRSQRILKIIDGLLPKKMTDKDKAIETEHLLQFCTELSKIYPRHKDLYNWMDVDQRVYVPYNLSHLQEDFGYIRWKTLLNATLGASTLYDKSHRQDPQDQNLGSNDDRFLCVYVTAPHYFRGLGKLLNSFSRRILIDDHRLWWIFESERHDPIRNNFWVDVNAVVHNGLLLLYATDTLHDVVNVTASKNWNVSCSNMAKSMFSSAVGALYVQQYSPEYLDTIANRVEILFERVKETLAERILVKTWLDEETRMQALLKLSALTGKFHVWPGFHNESFVAREMSKVTIDTDDFFSTVTRRFRQIRSVNDEVFRRNASERFRHPYAVNAYYESSTNSIVIPIAMMTAWSWSWDGGPAYAAHATLGSIIGHEILHAFDLHHRGQSLDTDHLLWLTPETWRRLEARIECVAKLYARSFWRKVKFFGNNVDVQFDWNVTRNENVADIGALQIAHETWQTLTNAKDRTLPGLEALRPNQLFFISAAQTYCSNMTAEAYILSVELDYHTPHPERVNGIMMNSEAFAEAFRCRANARMNPPEKCSTW